MSCVKARDQTIFSQFIPNLRKVIERTKNLKKEKVIITILKEGIEIKCEDLLEELASCPNSTFIFLTTQDSQRISFEAEGFYVVDFQNYVDIDLILGEKSIKKADNIVYLF